MKQIAVLYTCFNRKEKTLNALDHLYLANKYVENRVALDIYLTDDGSSDGTGTAVKERFPHVKVLQGNGNLYWAGGMRNSWNEALKKSYDAYLLLNDDTYVYESLFPELLETHTTCLTSFGKPGIYIGSTTDGNTNKLTYGGAVFTNKFLARYKKLQPNGKPQRCELGNANIMLVPEQVVNEIGILSDKFIHGLADFDYSLIAGKKNIPLLVTPHFLGVCLHDHSSPYETFHLLTLQERIKKLYSPIGLDFKSNLQYMKRNFPMRLPLVYLAGWLKVLFPTVYVKSRFKG